MGRLLAHQPTERSNDMKEKIEVKAVYDKDSKRFHRLLIEEGQEIVGTIYVPKKGKVPDSVTVTLHIHKKIGVSEDEVL